MQVKQYNIAGKEIEELKESAKDTVFLDESLYGKLVPLCVLNNGKKDGILFDCYCGNKALIDNEWYKDCSKYLWVMDARGYALMNLSKDNLKMRGITKPKGKTLNIKLHRYVSGVSNTVPLHIDHINGNVLDNTRNNLRLASRRDNARNATKNRGASKYKGVTVRENYSKRREEYPTYFQAQITIGGEKHSKCFDSEIDAAKYYDYYIRKHYPSKFNVYNFPKEEENSVFR